VRIDTLYKISFYLKTNPKIFFIDENELEVYREVLTSKSKQFGLFNVERKKKKGKREKWIEQVRKENKLISSNRSIWQIKEKLISTNEKDIKTGIRNCYKNKYFDVLWNDVELETNEWTAKIGAILALRTSSYSIDFLTGAKLSVEYFNELYKESDHEGAAFLK
jgi:hypothetical protein